MSGGTFDYGEWRIYDIADHIEQKIVNNEILEEDASDYQKSQWKGYRYSPEVVKELKKGLKLLRQAYIYAHRIDYLFDGDDCEESFLRRLKKELQDLEDTFEYKDI